MPAKPQAGDASIPACGSASDDRKFIMTFSVPADCHADHHKAVCVNGEPDVKWSDGDQLARSSEMTLGDCREVHSHGGVNPYERWGTRPSDSTLLPRDCTTRDCGDGNAGVLA